MLVNIHKAKAIGKEYKEKSMYSFSFLKLILQFIRYFDIIINMNKLLQAKK